MTGDWRDRLADDRSGANSNAMVIGGIIALVIGVVVCLWPHRHPAPAPSPAPSINPSPSHSPLVAAPGGVKGPWGRLPEITTDATIPAAPPDPDRDVPTGGLVAHNNTTVVAYDAPAGRPIGRLPDQQLGCPTWLPVIAQQPGWVQVLLPSRPNGSTGWLAAAAVEVARTPFVVEAHLGTATVRLLRDGVLIGQWPAGVGTAATPTPVGRTFLLANIVDPQPTFAAVILPLGAHSPTLADYDGGPATVALHSWPVADVYGHPVSHGCLRVPDAAIAVLRTVPLGSLVLITAT